MTARRIIIVGSGVAAALVATRLLERDKSLSILMLEAGPRILMRDRRKWQDMVTAGVDPYQDHKETDSDAGIVPQDVGLAGSRLFGRGGSTAHWNGGALRFKPEDFVLHTNTGREIDWPFGYDTLEPYYHEAELALGVEGDSTADDPPRKGRQYPFEAPPFVGTDGPVLAAFEASGISYGHVPMARSNRCITTGTCIYCPVGGKYSADLTLDALGNDPRFELRVNAPVRRVLLRDKRSASGVEYVDMSTGARRREDADAVVICAGALESPKLLLASADLRWPQGIGNHSRHLGRHLKAHDKLWVTGILAKNPKRLRHELDFPMLYTRHFDTPKEQHIGKFYFANVGTDEFPKPLNQLMQGGTSAAELDVLGQGPVSYGFYGCRENFATDLKFVKLAPGSNRFGLPRMEVGHTTSASEVADARFALSQMGRVLETMGARDIKMASIVDSTHFAGATRMTKNAADGVVDENLTVYEMANLHVCSNSVFPSIAGVNPTLTLAALALRLADHLCS